MSFLLKEIPASERPRERLIKYGVHSLSNYELLAIVLRSGNKNRPVMELARDLLGRYDALSRLNEATIEELREIKGIGEIKAVELLAAIEIGRRINIPDEYEIRLNSPQQSYLFLKDSMQHLTQEHLIAVYLNTQSEVIAKRTISIGTLTHTLFNSRDIFKWGLKLAAAGIIIAHNHPSGNPEPSREDHEITKRLTEGARLLDIIIIDHLIIGKGRYYSFVENKKL